MWGRPGFLLLVPQRRVAAPYFRVPNSDTWVYLFDILTSSATTVPPADFAARLSERNWRL